MLYNILPINFASKRGVVLGQYLEPQMLNPTKFLKILAHVIHYKDDVIAGHCEIHLLC